MPAASSSSSAAAAPPPPPAGGEGGFHEELRGEIQRYLPNSGGRPFGMVYPEQERLIREGDMTVPYHVWIGPNKWDKDPIQLNREHEKFQCLNQLLLQAMNNADGNNNNLLLQLIRGVDEKLGDIRGYRGPRKELVKRMLLDGCYIVFKFAKCPPKDNGRPSPGLQGSHHGLLHMKLVGPCCRLISSCIMDRIRGVHNTRDLESGGREMHPVGETAQAAATVAEEAANNSNRSRWLECRDTWCLVDNHVPYDVLDVINHLVYRAPEGGFGGASARILLQWWSLYYYVPPSQVDIVPRATVQQAEAGDANCLLILLAQLLKPQPGVPRLLNRTCCPPVGGSQEGDEQSLRGWRRATEYDRRCNARFVAAPLDATERRTVLDVTATIRGCFCSIDVQVPPLTIDGCSLALLRSLVELEQRGITADRYVTAYCLFMHKIASRAEDVELLTEQGIINHVYTDPMDVARGLEKVVENFHTSDAHPYLLPIEHELGRRYKSTVHRRLSWFRVSHWSKGDVIALIAALISVVSLIYAALSYHPGKS